jgi:hypothetical protein
MSDLPLSITHGSSLAVIADSVCRASSVTPLLYVERRGMVLRWAHELDDSDRGQLGQMEL